MRSIDPANVYTSAREMSRAIYADVRDECFIDSMHDTSRAPYPRLDDRRRCDTEIEDVHPSSHTKESLSMLAAVGASDLSALTLTLDKRRLDSAGRTVRYA